ncbi:MAG: Ada metal-binding domain-containing protein [Planctomycetota bacterium]
MKTQKNCLYMIILVACMFPHWLHAAMTSSLELRGSKEPALVGIDVNNLAVKVAGDVNSGTYAEFLRGIESLTRSDIRTACAGFPLSSSHRRHSNSYDQPLLRVSVHIVDLDDKSSVCFVRTCLIRTVCLAEDCSAFFKAVVWETPPSVETLDRSTLQTELAKIVSEQAKSFTHSFIMSNPRLLPDVDKPSAKQSPRTISRDVTEQSEQTQSTFVASKNSKVFHKPGCPFAQQILPKNLVTYSSKNEAVAAGKRPCKSCNP